MLITFSGLDGAGKSTLIESLRASLEEQNRRVAVFHMNKSFGVYAYLRFVRGLIFGRNEREKESPAPEHSIAERSVAKRIVLRARRVLVWGRFSRRWVYLVDLVIFLFYRIYIEKLSKRILIMDRYFYDRLVDVADGRRWLFLRFLERITPTPTVPIMLDVSPEESYARKGEFSVVYLRRRYLFYKHIFPWVRSHVVVTTSKDVDAARRLVEKLVIERLAAQ